MFSSQNRRLSVPQRQQAQPRTFKLSVKALLSLPYRLCNPPAPTVGKVRSCGVTPVYKVQLDDILDRKHLPPLGLKDFEEWLLYVEQSPENLYFTLWLREYTQKYNQWAIQSKSVQRPDPGSYRVTWPTQTSSTLAMFYACAKQTFFTPNSDYELNVPSDVLAPFHTSNFGSPHPDPAVFAEVACEVREMLNASLQRFVIAAYTNVGTYRALCGTVGGVVIALVGSVPPIVYNIVVGKSRWLRLLALPGMWLGLMVILASLHGVCMMVYIFGDLRQLRKFEMSRPSISRPQLLTHTPRNRLNISSPISVPTPITRPPILPITRPPRITIPTPHVTIQPPAPAVVHEPHSPTHIPHSPSSSSLASTASYTTSSSSSSCSEPGAIYISPAYYDEDPAPEGPATSPLTPTLATPSFKFPSHKENASSTFTATAPFIHQYESFCDDDYEGAGHAPAPESRQPISPFNFDALPARNQAPPPSPPLRRPLRAEKKIEPSPQVFKLTPLATLRWIQTKCIGKFVLTSADSDTGTDPEKALVDTPAKRARPFFSTSKPAPPASVEPSARPRPEPQSLVNAQYKKIQAVPAFASPLTRVLSPVVTRAQWEIVMRSSIVSLLICWIVLGCLLAVPEKRH